MTDSKCPECNQAPSKFKDQWIGCSVCPTAWVCFECALKSLPCFNSQADKGVKMSQKFYNDILDKQNNGNVRWHYICVKCEDKLHCCTPNQTVAGNDTNKNGSIANPNRVHLLILILALCQKIILWTLLYLAQINLSWKRVCSLKVRL